MNYEELANNKVYLAGEVQSAPVFSHEVFGEGFYEFQLSVLRLSNQTDILPVTVSERLLNQVDLTVGNRISVSGQFRSYNKLTDSRSKLMLTVFARTIEDYDPEVNPNIIQLDGYICKQPMYRTTPFKREICDMLLAVNRAYNKSDYIPCIAWGRNARYVNTLHIGDHIVVYGRIQSRQYVKVLSDGTEETRTAYEVSVSRLNTDDGVEQTDGTQDQIQPWYAGILAKTN